LLAHRPIPNLEDHPLSAVCDCLFNILAATLLIEGRHGIKCVSKYKMPLTFLLLLLALRQHYSQVRIFAFLMGCFQSAVPFYLCFQSLILNLLKSVWPLTHKDIILSSVCNTSRKLFIHYTSITLDTVQCA
jgi:hypothetical protein